MQAALAGRLRGEVECGNCGHISATQQVFTHLSLDLPTDAVPRDGVALEELLLSYLSTEKLDGAVYK